MRENKIKFRLKRLCLLGIRNIINIAGEKQNEHMFNILFLMESSFSAGTLLWLLRKFVGCGKVGLWRSANKKYENKVGELYDWLNIIAIPARQKLFQLVKESNDAQTDNIFGCQAASVAVGASNDWCTGKRVRDFFAFIRLWKIDHGCYLCTQSRWIQPNGNTMYSDDLECCNDSNPCCLNGLTCNKP